MDNDEPTDYYGEMTVQAVKHFQRQNELAQDGIVGNSTWDAIDQLTRLEKKVADYVLQHPQEVVKMTINELSNSCGVGDTTVFRFCRSMNVGGYQDFKLALALSSNVNDMLDSKGEFNLAQSHDRSNGPSGWR